MTPPLTPTRLAEIEARAAAATPGPWTHIGERIYAPDTSGSWVVAESAMWAQGSERDDYEKDAAFIAGAREDVPALLAEVRRLQERDALRSALLTKAIDQWQDAAGYVSDHFREKWDHTEADIEKVREEMAAMDDDVKEESDR